MKRTTFLFLIIIGGFLINQLLLARYNATASSVENPHHHADLNIYINGERLILAKPENYMKSSFLHVDSNQNFDDANSVLHMHAKNIPLRFFFKSIGTDVSKGSKFYLNGKKVDNLENYVFQDLDKILISYGPENDPDMARQIKSMTNFARDHQK